MEKSKIRRRDRLSELPEPLIFHILWFLPMRDVVRTSVLSKHWRNLWTTAPFLNFDYDHIDDDMNRIRDFVNRALILWEGVKIQKFKIDLNSSSVDDSFCGDFDFWLCFALRKKVQELYVRIPYEADYVSDSLPLPQNLYSCSSLEVLSLVHCHLQIDGNVQWDQLQSLRIHGAYITEHEINQVLCGSPQLEVFSLTLLEGYENLSIRSSSLKRLSIDYGEVEWYPSCLIPEVRIWTPNLETFKISSGVPYAKCYLEDVSSLTHLNLGFYMYLDGKVLLRKTLKRVFQTIQHVEKVTLSDSCIKVWFLRNAFYALHFDNLIQKKCKCEEMITLALNMLDRDLIILLSDVAGVLLYACFLGCTLYWISFVEFVAFVELACILFITMIDYRRIQSQCLEFHIVYHNLSSLSFHF